ncbi:hypothetical protein MMC11_007562 [Xylographa trunciseda]|nr:hypothetical protein [Xylographa trunciseda]
MPHYYVTKGRMLLNFLAAILLEDATLRSTLRVFRGNKIPMTEKEEKPLVDCVELYAKQLLLSDSHNPNRGFAAYILRSPINTTISLVELAWEVEERDKFLVEEVEQLVKADPDFWVDTIQHNLLALAADLKAASNDPKAKHNNLREQIDRLCKNTQDRVKHRSKAPSSKPYSSLRRYLRNEIIYGPFLQSIWKKFKIKPSLQSPGTYIREVATEPVDATKAIDATEPVAATESVNATKPIAPTKPSAPTKSVHNTTQPSTRRSHHVSSADATEPDDTANRVHSKTHRRRHHHSSRTTPAAEEPHGRRRT